METPVSAKSGNLNCDPLAVNDQFLATISALSAHFHACSDTVFEGFAVIIPVRDEADRIVDFSPIYLSEAVCQSLNISSPPSLGKSLWESWPTMAAFHEELAQVIISGKPVVLQINPDSWVPNGCFSLYASKLSDGLALSWCRTDPGKSPAIPFAQKYESPLSLARVNQQLCLNQVHPGAETITGFPASLLVGKSLTELGNQHEFFFALIDQLQAVFATGTPGKLMYQFTPDDPAYLCHLIPQFDVASCVEDVAILLVKAGTAQQQPYISDFDYQTILEYSPFTIARFDKNFNYQYIHKKPDDSADIVADFIAQKSSFQQGVGDSNYSPWKRELEIVFAAGIRSSFETQLTTSSSLLKSYRIFMIPAKDLAGNMDYVLMLFLDITEYKQMEERFLKAFHNNSTLMIITSLQEGQIIDVNSSFAQAFGFRREDIIGRTITDIGMWPNKDARSAFTQQLFRNGKVRNLEQRYITRSNEHRSFLLSSDLITFDNMPCVLSVCRDITEKTIFAAEMARLDRLNLVGEMAASLGHEIRNPLTTVRGYLQVFLRNSQFSQYFKQLTTMIEELDRANSIITEFLSLAKNKTIDLHPDNINNVIIALAPLLQADALRMGHNLLIEFGILPEIVFDEKEIRQLLLNLVRNALEAMSPGGKAIIKTHLDRDWVVLTVEDNGPGISEELFNRLGTPFVTTKPNGFGLGLPVCFRIAQRHDANINIDTSTLGTTFEVRFSTKSAELPLQMGCR